MSPMSGEAPRSALILWLRQFARLWGLLLFVLVVLIAFRSVVLPGVDPLRYQFVGVR